MVPHIWHTEERLMFRVLEKRVLRAIRVLNREERAVDWRRLHNEKLYLPYSSNIRVIKSRTMGWAGHVACMRERGGSYGGFVG
jgi:hypothetical protein